MKKIIIFIILFVSGVSCFGQTRNVIVNTNGVVISPTNFWSADASNARTGLGINTSLFQPSSSVLTNLAANNGSSLTNLTASNIVGSIPLAANVSGIVSVTNGGTGANTASGARANLGLGTSDSPTFSALTVTGDSFIGNLNVTNGGITLKNNSQIFDLTNSVYFVAPSTNIPNVDFLFSGTTTNITIYKTLAFSGGVNLGVTRTNLGIGATWLTNTNVTNFRSAIGLGWTALTNTSLDTFSDSVYGAGNRAVVVGSSGSVISPANFWTQAPVNTILQEVPAATNSTNQALNARNLFLYSLQLTNTGVTNVIKLPTNASTIAGDVATIAHEGPTNSLTIIRSGESTNNIISLNQLQESVRLIYRGGAWGLADNISYIEPIYFSGTNAAVNAAASRTNLGLGATWLTNTDVTNFRTAIGLGTTNNVTFSALTLSSDLTLNSGDNIVLSTTTGTKIGTATNQLLGFYNQTPITRPSSTGVTTNGFTTGGGGGTTVHANSTFTGGIGTNAYTISDIVAHLKSLGLIAP